MRKLMIRSLLALSFLFVAKVSFGADFSFTDAELRNLTDKQFNSLSQIKKDEFAALYRSADIDLNEDAGDKYDLIPARTQLAIEAYANQNFHRYVDMRPRDSGARTAAKMTTTAFLVGFATGLGQGALGQLG